MGMNSYSWGNWRHPYSVPLDLDDGRVCRNCGLPWSNDCHEQGQKHLPGTSQIALKPVSQPRRAQRARYGTSSSGPR